MVKLERKDIEKCSSHGKFALSSIRVVKQHENAQLDADSSRDDIVTLLQKYGRHIITNPYVLAD